jgi:transcriptional regulator with AAA-type ATPase domain
MNATTTTLPRSVDESSDGARVPYLFAVFRADRPLAPPTRHALARLAEVRLGRASGGPTSWTRERDALDLRIDDARMSSAHAKISRALHRFAIEDLGSRNGTLVNGARVERAALSDGDLIELGHSFFIFRELPDVPGAPLDERVEIGDGPAGLATVRPDLAAEMQRLRLAAASRETVMILGESGTGKELVARAIHALSGRRGDLVAVNCGALPESMVEAELFGHRRGAFSGAVSDRPGLVRSADGGTLFLDEVGDLRLTSQAALLRVLQEQEVMPVGGERPVKVDLRVVCATHQPLDQLVATGGFRGDLYARLRGFVLRLPPLRARREDFALMAGELLRRVAGDRAEKVELSGTAARALLLHTWPQNVRELEKALGTALALAAGGAVRREHLPENVLHPAPAATAAAARGGPDEGGDADDAPMDRERLVALLEEHRGNLAAVARAVGKGRTQVQRWVARFGVDPDQFRER